MWLCLTPPVRQSAAWIWTQKGNMMLWRSLEIFYKLVSIFPNEHVGINLGAKVGQRPQQMGIGTDSETYSNSRNFRLWVGIIDSLLICSSFVDVCPFLITSFDFLNHCCSILIAVFPLVRSVLVSDIVSAWLVSGSSGYVVSLCIHVRTLRTYIFCASTETTMTMFLFFWICRQLFDFLKGWSFETDEVSLQLHVGL